MKRIARFTRMQGDPVTVARRLLGQRLVRVIDGQRLAGTIVEVEAYLGAIDRAAHTFGGRRTARNASMYLPAGHAYVYFTYGMHHCLNVVCGRANEGVAVLIRAIEPTEGIDQMRSNRGTAASTDVRLLCSGPARLASALAIDRSLDGLDLRSDTGLFIEELRRTVIPEAQILRTSRIGLNLRGNWPPQHMEWVSAPLRLCLAGHASVSGRPSLSVRDNGHLRPSRQANMRKTARGASRRGSHPGSLVPK